MRGTVASTIESRQKISMLRQCLLGLLTVVPSEVPEYTAFCVQSNEADGYREYSAKYRDDNDSMRDRLWVVEVRGHTRRSRHCPDRRAIRTHVEDDVQNLVNTQLIV